MSKTSDKHEKDLQREIEMLRDGIEHLHHTGSELEDVDELIRKLNAMGLAATRLAAMLKAQEQLETGSQSSVLSAIQRAIARTANEQGLS